MQRMLVIIGLLLVAAGLCWPWLMRLPLGRLPGDIVIHRPGLHLYFPLTTMVLVSLLLTLIGYFLRR